MKTIKQLADEIGVTKQAVFYRIKKAPLSNALQPLIENIDGVLMVSFDGETLIKQAFSVDIDKPFADKNVSNSIPNFDSNMIKLVQDNISVLQQQLKIKDSQLEIRDKQVEELTNAVRIQAESINADRKNELAETLIDRHRELSDSESSDDPLENPENQPVKQGLFKRLFKRK